MNISELLGELKKLNISLSNRALAQIWGMDEAAFSRKKKAGTPIKQKNIEEIEKTYNIKLTRSNNNSLLRQNDTTITKRFEKFGWRLGEIQDKNEYLDKDMAKLLKISEQDYIYLKCGDVEPDIEILNRIKQLFIVSMDWLLYGD